jgi:hypothetical protein
VRLREFMILPRTSKGHSWSSFAAFGDDRPNIFGPWQTRAHFRSCRAVPWEDRKGALY